MEPPTEDWIMCSSVKTDGTSPAQHTSKAYLSVLIVNSFIAMSESNLVLSIIVNFKNYLICYVPCNLSTDFAIYSWFNKTSRYILKSRSGNFIVF